MIGDIRRHLETFPFVPFTINMADGRKVQVPTRDHIAFLPTRVIVTHDDGSWDVLPGLLMSGLTIDQVAAQPDQP